MKNGGKNKSVAFIILVSVYIYIYIYIYSRIYLKFDVPILHPCNM